MTANLSGPRMPEEASASNQKQIDRGPQAEASADDWREPKWYQKPQAMAMLLLVIAIGAALFIWKGFNKETESNSIELSGRIEAPETHISAPSSTHVNAVYVKEGDSVKKGQLLINLDAQQVTTKISQSRSAIGAAAEARRQADRQVALVQQDINAARKKSKGFWTKVFTTPSGRKQKENELRGRMMQAKMMQMQAHSMASQAQTVQTIASSKLSYFQVKSPIDGICVTRSTEPGELVSAGQVLLTIVNPKSAYMRGFIPEGKVSQVKIGQRAEVYFDSDKHEPLGAKVTAIDAKASFTPEDVYFKDDRVRQVFGIKLTLDKPDGHVKPGMSADAKIPLETGDRH